MGYFTEYLDRGMSFEDLAKERKKQLAEISRLRGGRAVLVFAADLQKGHSNISMSYPDLLALNDQLANLQGDKIDLILETPGGSGEVAEEIVRQIRGKFAEVGVIVPGWAKSAGTLITMAADEILMGATSALGPIDAQIGWQGKNFSAGELLDGMQKIKEEVTATGHLNKTYVPILSGISPGELQRAENAQEFGIKLVEDWLARYKFRSWVTHSSTGQPVTQDERRERAHQIASQLRNHRVWLTHGRSIKIADLQEMRLLVTDITQSAALNEAVMRYYTLLQMTLESSGIYKLFETPTSQIYRFALSGNGVDAVQNGGGAGLVAALNVKCTKCGTEAKVQANLGVPSPLKAGHIAYPKDNRFLCNKCGAVQDLTAARRTIEMKTKRPLVFGEN
jgi:hypothetical protein